MEKITKYDQSLKHKLQLLNSELTICKWCVCKLEDLDQIVEGNEKTDSLQHIIERLRRMLRDEIDDMKVLLQHTK